MKIKVSNTTDVQLDWLVAKCEALDWDTMWKYYTLGGPQYTLYSPSTHWNEGGPIMEREKIGLREPSDACKPDGTIVLKIDYWYAHVSRDNFHAFVQNGPTPLIAAMRCYVVSQMGLEVEVPDELFFTKELK